MISVFIAATGLVCILLALTTLLQTLYLECLRLRMRELRALEHFKDTLHSRLGLETEQGALLFSLWKHTLLAFLGILTVAITVETGHIWQDLAEAAGISWALMMVFAYVIPQMLYRKTSGTWLDGLVPFIHLLALAMRPLAALLGFLQSLAELNEPAESVEEANSQGEDIEALIEAGAEEGLIAEEDRQLIQSVVEFGDKTVRAVMTPRPSVVAISEDATLEEFKQLVLNEKYSRIPVYRKDLDDMVGFVHVHDLFATPESELAQRRVRELARPIRLVPETQPVRKLLDEMKRDGVHMVAVVSEYGSTAGLATMEDLVEEILGEIRDEHEPSHDYEQERPGVFVVAGSYDLDNLREHVGYERDEETEATTVGGLASEWFGRVPAKGEVIDRHGIRLEILEAQDLRVEKVRVMRVPEPEPAPATVKENGTHV